MTEQPRCSLFADSFGEDPIGTAVFSQKFLLVEVPLPWGKGPGQSPDAPPGLMEATRAGMTEGIHFQAIAPDPDFSKSGHTRIVFLERTSPWAAGYDRLEYLAPRDSVGALLQAIVKGNDLAPFASLLAQDRGVRDLLVCTHGSHDPCCGTFGYPLYAVAKKLADPAKVRVWRTSHTGGHRFTPTALDFPTAHAWSRLDEATLEIILAREGPTPALRRQYRGWSAVGFFEQIAERESLERYGWKWLSYQKEIRVLGEHASLFSNDYKTLAIIPQPKKEQEHRPIPPDITPEMGAMFRRRREQINPLIAAGLEAPKKVQVQVTYRTPGGQPLGRFLVTEERTGIMQAMGDCGHPPFDRYTYAVTSVVAQAAEETVATAL